MEDLEKLWEFIIPEQRCIIYFLYDDDELVYIWQSANWMSRPLSHSDKKYNRLVLYKAPEDKIYRENVELSLIDKYRPKYNKFIWNNLYILSKQEFFNKDANYKTLEYIKWELKLIWRYDITAKIKLLVRKNIHNITRWKTMYVDYNDIRLLILDKYLLDINTIKQNFNL